MPKRVRVFLFGSILSFIVAGAATAGDWPSARIPLVFERASRGAGPDVTYVARSPGHALFLTRSGGLRVADARNPLKAIAMRLVGARRRPDITPLEPSGTSHYLLGGDVQRWRTGVANYGRVEYRNVYPGVDLVYYGTGRQLEYDFLVSAGACWSCIRLAFDGVLKMRVDSSGGVELETGWGRIRHHPPAVYQGNSKGRRRVQARFVAAGPREVRFDLGVHDPGNPLTIDPVISYSTFMGGSMDDHAYGVAVDGAGCAYIVGETWSSDFPHVGAQPIAGGERDVFITKLNRSGTGVVFSTYVGGRARDSGRAIAVDPGGNVYVAGFTYSQNFPVTAGSAIPSAPGQADAFVLKLDPSGRSLLYATFLGGKGNDFATGVAVNTAGEAHITGYTSSTDFPVAGTPVQSSFRGGFFDVFIAQLNASGSALRYSTFVGGSGNDTATAIAVGPDGGIYVAGQTDSRDFPVRSALQSASRGTDAFALKLDSAGKMSYATYLGGSASDFANGVAVDGTGQAYIAGGTFSSDFPVTPGSLQGHNHGDYDAFIAKLSVAGNQLLYSTFLGGSAADEAKAIALDADGRAFVAGWTGSTDFPVLYAIQEQPSGGMDGFVAALDERGATLLYSTYLGGTAADVCEAVAAGSTGTAYLAGYTLSSDFRVAQGAPRSTFGGGEAFISKLSTAGLPKLISPVPGSVLTTASATFQWDPGAASQCHLCIGTATGDCTYFNQNMGISSSATAVLAVDGRELYVRLWGLTDDGWKYTDYAYQACSGCGRPQMTAPAPAATLGGSRESFYWDPGIAVQFHLCVGTQAAGMCNIFNQNVGTSTSAVVSSLPTDGTAVYIRLWGLFRDGWMSTDYVYTASSSSIPQMTSPAPGETLAPTTAFSWVSGGAVQFHLYIGTLGPGSSNIYSQNTGAATFASIPGIPSDGSTLYVRLFGLLASGWRYRDYTYRARAAAILPQLMSPAPGAILAPTSTYFSWTAGDATQYHLMLGTVGPGSANVFSQNTGASTGVLVSGLPANANTLYVRLWALLGGTWRYVDYVYGTR